MKQHESDGVMRCPACGAPRLAHAWDCGQCGAVFDAGPPPAVPDGQPPPVGTGKPATERQASPVHRTRSSSARRPGSKPPKAAPTAPVWLTAGLAGLRDWVEQNKTVAVIISFVFYIAVVWLFGTLIIGATDSPGSVKSAYREVTGRPLPEGFGPTFAAHFVSRRLIVLDRPDQVVLILYRDEDGASDGELVGFAEGVLEIFEIPYETVKVRTATTEEGKIEVPVMRLWGEGGPHLYLVPTATTDGDRAVEAVLGAPDKVLEIVEEMVEYR